ncbi:MAG: hypothetical protein WBA13_17695 [Microcoleaceae cyanobacterium]
MLKLLIHGKLQTPTSEVAEAGVKKIYNFFYFHQVQSCHGCTSRFGFDFDSEIFLE